MDRSKIARMRADIDKAMRDIAKKYDMVSSLGNITYDESSFRFKTNFKENAGGSGYEPAYREPFTTASKASNRDVEKGIQALKNIGISCEDLATHKFHYKRSVFTFDSFNSKAPKFCFIMKNLSGAKYKMTASQVGSMM